MSADTADEEKKPSRSFFSWFPKLLLWGSVLVFAYLYLDSINFLDTVKKHSGELAAYLKSSATEERAPEIRPAKEEVAAAPATAPSYTQAPMPSSQVPAPAASAPVAPSMSAPAPAPVAARVPSQVAPVQPAPALPQVMPTQPSVAAVAAPSAEEIAQRQARILSEYEAMRRNAEEQMRQYWEQRQSSEPPMATPYPYGYYPGYYAPAYYGPAPMGYPAVR